MSPLGLVFLVALMAPAQNAPQNAPKPDRESFARQSLQDLVTEGYLTKIPIDPFTGDNSSWQTVMEEASQSMNQSEPGIYDVKSSSSRTSSDGTPYSEW